MKKTIVAVAAIVSIVAGGVAGYAMLKPNEFNSLLKMNIASQDDVYFDASKISDAERALYKLTDGSFAPLLFSDAESVVETVKHLDPKALEYIDTKEITDTVDALAKVLPYRSGVKYFANKDGIDVCAIYMKPSEETLPQAFVYQELIAKCKVESTDPVKGMVNLTKDEAQQIADLAEKYKMKRSASDLISLTVDRYWGQLYIDTVAIQNTLNGDKDIKLDELLDQISDYRKNDAHESFERQAKNTSSAIKALKGMYESGEVTASTAPEEVFSLLISKRNEYLPPLDKFFILLLHGYETVTDRNFARDWILEDKAILKYLDPKMADYSNK